MGMSEFARAAVRQAGAREWRGLALALFLLLTITNIVLVLYAPARGETPGTIFSLAGAARGIGLLSISVAMLRVAAASPRGRWSFDAGFFLYFALSLLALALTFAIRLAAGTPGDGALSFVGPVAELLLLAPLAPWMVAAAVDKPLARDPRPWLRDFGAWLPPLLLLSVPVALLGAAHAMSSLHLLAIGGDDGAFWPLAVADGLVSTTIVLATLALRLTAWRTLRPAAVPGYPAADPYRKET